MTNQIDMIYLKYRFDIIYFDIFTMISLFGLRFLLFILRFSSGPK